MSDVFDPALLLNSLEDWREVSAAQPLAQAYQRYYGVDFAGRLPDVQAYLGRLQVAGYQVAVQLWSPSQPRGTLFVMHGYYDHMGLYRHIIEWALQLGFAVMSCDLPGHGLSSGARASINEFTEYQTVLKALLARAEQLALPKPWHVLGQSTGGAILVDYLLHNPHAELDRSILFAPLVRPRAWNWSQLSYQMLRHFVAEIPRRFTDNSGDQAFLQFIRQQDPLQPQTLPTAWVGALQRWVPRIEGAQRTAHSPIIVQGQQDRTVDWQHNLSVLQDKFQTPETLLLEDAKHHLANERAEVRQRYFDFLRERLT